MKAQGWSRSITPSILNLGTRCRWLVIFTSRPLCPRQKTLAHIDNGNGWAPEKVWTFWIRISYHLLRSSVSVQPVFSRFTFSTRNSGSRYKISLDLKMTKHCSFPSIDFIYKGKIFIFCLMSYETFISVFPL